MKTRTFRTFSVPKGLSSPAENEDAYGIVERSSSHVFALADGASQAIGSDAWARLLVRAPARVPWSALTSATGSHDVERQALLEGVDAWLLPLRARWRRYEHWRLGARIHHWSVHNKLLEGAYATFLAVNLEPREDGGASWRALAVGDACLFILEKEALTVRFPIQEAKAYNSRPVMFGTRSLGAQAWREALQVRSGEVAAGSWVFAMTDAIGKWFLTRLAEGERPWDQLLRFGTEEEFTRWVVEARQTQQLETDDTTLLFGQI
jgi:hypothetical protein